MPPYRKKPTSPCWSQWAKRVVHHLIWMPAGNGRVVYGCAHCSHTSGSHDDVGDPQLIERQCRHSRDAHARACSKL